MQKPDAASLRNRFEADAERRVPRRTRKQSARERPVIKAGAANDNRELSAAVDVADGRRGVARVLGGGVLARGIGNIDEVMWNPTLIGRRDLIGTDIKPAIDRGRIAVDDLAIEPLGERERERTLAGGRRPEHGNEQLRHLPESSHNVDDKSD